MLKNLNMNELYEVSGGSDYYKSGEEDGTAVGKVARVGALYVAARAVSSFFNGIINTAKAAVFL